jgi:hypothetical protein
VLPADKAHKVSQLQAASEIVAMVGDGTNDAPALAQADVRIVLGTGADGTLEAADLTLIRDDLALIPQTIKLSRRDNGHYPAKPVLGVLLQRGGHPCRGHDLELCERGRPCGCEGLGDKLVVGSRRTEPAVSKKGQQGSRPYKIYLFCPLLVNLGFSRARD